MNTVKATLNNGEVKEYNVGTTYYEISKDVKLQNKILGVKINNKNVSLNKKIEKDETLNFFDLSDVVGYKMYQCALKFIFEVAVNEIFENTDVTFVHSVPKGVLAKIKGKNLFKDEVNQIRAKMEEIIKGDYPFTKFSVFKRDAMKLYEDIGCYEKRDNIHNLSNAVVTIYKLREKINYFYVDLPYSTGSVDKFELVDLGKNKIILLFPSVRTDGEVPAYEHFDAIIDSFEKSKEWLTRMNINYLTDINNLVSESKIKAFILSNELVYNISVYEVCRKIASDPNKKIVLISGPSSSGKTTTTRRTSSYFTSFGLDPISISIDDYFLDRDKTPLASDGEPDFESIRALNIEKFESDIINLLAGKEIQLPRYNFLTGKSEMTNKKIQMKEKSIILVEGLHAINDEALPDIPSEQKYKIYLSPFVPLAIDRDNYISTIDLRLIRRIVRDNRTRNHNIESTIKAWQKVRDGEEKNIFPYIHHADIIINSGLAYEIGVLKVYIIPLLYSVKVDSPYYEEARRLISYLQLFYTIPSEYVNKDSVLREFIGGGLLESD